MASLQRRPRKSGRDAVRAMVRRRGRTWSRTFNSWRAASRWARALEAELDAGHGVPDAGGHTLAALVERYTATVLPGQKSGAQTEARLRRWLALLGDRPLVDISARDLAEARDRLAVQVSPATVRRYLSALSAAFNRAIKDWQWLAINPAREIIWPREPRGRVRYLSDDELARLRASTRTVDADLADLVELALLSGMRRGELLGLTWGAVDWGHARLLLLETKNDERRQIPLVASALAILRRRVPPGWRPETRVFYRRGAPLQARDFRAGWVRALRLAGIDNFRFHDLRHTAASYLAMSGATSNQIAEILGHRTLGMVKRYAHLSIENQGAALEKLERRLAGGG